MPRILLIQLKRIGDLVLTAPAVAALRAGLPEAEIVMVTPRNVAELASNIVGVDRVIAYHASRVNLETWASAIMGPWDACLDFTGTDRSALLTKFTSAGQRIGYAKFAGPGLRKFAYSQLCDASVRDLHTVDFHLALVRELGLPAPDPAQPSPPLRIPPEIERLAQEKLQHSGITGPYAIVHPGTAREEKFWDDARWAEVIRQVQHQRGLPVVLTGSGDGLEHPHLQAIRAGVNGTPVADLTGRLSLLELAALLAEAQIVLGVDSMAMHITALFQRPQIALFGPTNPFHWQPRHSRGYVLTPHDTAPRQVFQPKEQKGAMSDISTESVMRAMDLALRPQ